MRVYFDSSAFAKRYIDEPGTAEVLTWCDQAAELVSAADVFISADQRQCAAAEAMGLRVIAL